MQCKYITFSDETSSLWVFYLQNLPQMRKTEPCSPSHPVQWNLSLETITCNNRSTLNIWYNKSKRTYMYCVFQSTLFCLKKTIGTILEYQQGFKAKLNIRLYIQINNFKMAITVIGRTWKRTISIDSQTPKNYMYAISRHLTEQNCFLKLKSRWLPRHLSRSHMKTNNPNRLAGPKKTIYKRFQGI